MTIIEKRINSFEEFTKLITTDCGTDKSLCCGHVVFRGVSDKKYQLISTVGRLLKRKQEDGLTYETELIEKFKKHSSLSLSVEPKNEWEWLALAQHHGLPTRLLDWSFSPLTALYFATLPRLQADGSLVENSKDAAVYAFHDCSYVDADAGDPYQIKRIELFLPPSVSPRIIGQSGLFTVSPDPTMAMEEQINADEEYRWLMKIIIPSVKIKAIQRALFLLGYRHSLLFPDLDGISYEKMLSLYFIESHSRN